MTHPLTSEDIAAVQSYHQVAERRLKDLLRLARAQIRRRRPYPPREGARPPAGLGFWEHVEHDERWPADSYFEWRATHDDLRHDPVGGFAIGAGVAWEQGDEPAERDHPEWFAIRFAEGFEYGVSRRRVVYLLRYHSLSDLVALTDNDPNADLSDQARALAEWADESWAMLEEDPLPSAAQ